MADSWEMLAEQEIGLTDEDNSVWNGDVFRDGDAAESYAFAPAPEGVASFLNPDNLDTYNAGLLTQNGYALNDPIAGTESGSNQEKGFSLTETIKEGAATVNSWVRSLAGGDDKVLGMIYSSAIMAGVKAILQGSQNNDVIKFKNADREDTQAHDKELLTTKYARDDAERERRNKVPTAGGRIKYNPNMTAGYKVPGQANGTQYGLLRGGK